MQMIVMENVTKTMNNLCNLKFSDFELELKDYAEKNNVPIIFDEGLAFLEMIIRLHKPIRILEIGTAIGYSAIRMSNVVGSFVVSIERNEAMYNKAIENVSKAGLDDKIKIIFKDALEAFDDVKDYEFDMIFIDAAKAQYMKFFNLYTPLLSSRGIVVCDNMLFHGLIEDKENYENQTRAVRGLIRKLGAFHEALLSNEDYTTSIYDIGDGMSISVKK